MTIILVGRASRENRARQRGPFQEDTERSAAADEADHRQGREPRQRSTIGAPPIDRETEELDRALPARELSAAAAG
jgi:hypothetical protein